MAYFSPPAALPETSSQPLTSHRYAGLQRLYKLSLDATLKANSYPNFAACFPTPAKYCPKALEGVWKQLNTRLEEECLKDFEKLCAEKGLEQALIEWEQLLEEAVARRLEASNEEQKDGRESTPMHMLTASQLHEAHIASTLIKTEKELQAKLDAVQSSNREMANKIERQRTEMLRLVEQIERIIEDVEGAATAIEADPMREELQNGIGSLPTSQQDTVMNG